MPFSGTRSTCSRIEPSQKERIILALKRAGHVRLALFDVAGREAQKLMDEDAGEGTHAVSLSAGDLAAGVYFLELKTSEGRSLSRVVLTK